MKITTKSVEDRFWSKVKKTETCWLWMLCDQSEYGMFYHTGSTVRAHRFSYELMHGPIPEPLVIDHLCRVKSCVNPKHLEAVTTKVNVLRGISFSAQNAKKISCPKGHLYTKTKTWRRCFICENRPPYDLPGMPPAPKSGRIIRPETRLKMSISAKNRRRK